MLNFFDPSFKKFSAPILIKIYYGLSVGLLAVFWLIMLVSGFNNHFLSGLLVLIVGPVLAFFLLIATRISCEWILATIQASQNTAKLVELMSGRPGQAGPPTTSYVSAPPQPPTH
ncbi:DUF4282 domain-containing protein [Arthrobacter citreus]|uniref:DUF4282 domain-containing protein n=1 Tax=Arthrobacter TaxID=1663 RepID=UPI0012643A1F|nr:DUF4282 domain-containing protein [Arthrobacter gandavensis]